MAVTKNPPHTIHLGGDIVLVNDLTASASVTPGSLVTRTAGQYTLATTGATQPAFALEQAEMNKSVDHLYASGDLIKVGVGRPGSTFWALLASGQNVTDGAGLIAATNGQLTAGTGPFRAIEAVNNTAGPGAARIRVEVL